MKSPDALFLSDTHIGALGGLCPPRHWESAIPPEPGETASNAARRLFVASVQREMWNWTERNILSLRPKYLVLDGDIIDGAQKKSAGVGVWSTKTKDQADAAISILSRFKKAGTRIMMCKGTRYHDEEYGEEYIADALGAHIAPHAFIEIEGVIFDVKHKETGANCPAGRPGLRNSHLNNLLWNARDQQPIADVTIRGHLHTFFYEGNDQWLGIVLPGMQWLSEYGQLEVGRPIMNGAVHFTNIQKGNLQWHPIIAKLPEFKAHIYKL
jgi:hypothetical protein